MVKRVFKSILFFPYKIDIWDKLLLAAYTAGISPSSFQTDPALQMVSGEAGLTRRTSQHRCSWRIPEGSLELLRGWSSGGQPRPAHLLPVAPKAGTYPHEGALGGKPG